MTSQKPDTDLDVRYGDEDARPTEWTDARDLLAEAELFWISTVRPDGRPHVTPVLSVWQDDALHFCTGPHERKALNLNENPHVALTTGTNTQRGMDLVVEGDAVRVTDQPALQRLAEAWESKYGPDWHFDVGENAFVPHGGEGEAWVFAVHPSTAFGFGKSPFSQTRWRFDQP